MTLRALFMAGYDVRVWGIRGTLDLGMRMKLCGGWHNERDAY